MNDRTNKTLRCTASVIFAIIELATTACSQQSSPSASARATDAVNPVGKDYRGPSTPCDKELSVKDAAELIKGPVSINHYSMTASLPGQGCELGAGLGFTAFIDISIKKADQQMYTNLIQMAGKPVPLIGVGDEAATVGIIDSNVPDAKEVDIIARKGTWICEADLIHKNGSSGDAVLVSTNDSENAKKLGALCNKLFADKS